MKTGLTSVDIYFLTGELNDELGSARVDKVYQISERELKIRVYILKEGSKELVIAPNYLCLTRYQRDVPEQPSSFAMQLRKHLKGAFITAIRQHRFDRIIEFELKKSGSEYFLITELFSNGNIILCNPERKILGLLEWQKWKDRRLGVGQIYQYPPEGRNPLEIDFSGFRNILKKSEKSLVATLTTDLSLGGIYAEELCLNSEIDKNKKSRELGDDEIKTLFNSFKRLIEVIKKGVKEPIIVLDESKRYLDVIPFSLSIYEKFEKGRFSTLNEAIDNYFIESESIEMRRIGEKKIQERLGKIQKIELEQRKTIKELEKKSEEYKKIGDLIYQNFQVLDKIMKSIDEERERGADWSEIGEKFIGKRFNDIRIENIEKNGSITLEVEEK